MANPFDDDAPDSFSAVSKGRGFRDLTVPDSDEEDADAELNVYHKQIVEAMSGTLESTQRSKGLLNESEEAGIRTAQNLVHQREQLERTNQNLDNINSSTVQTQRHLNNIKSVFGGLKNRFMKKAPEVTTSESKDSLKTAPSKLESHVAKMDADTSGFYSGGGSSTGPSLPESSRKGLNEALQQMDREVDENLDDMSAQLRRLQGLGNALGSEIEEQNDLLDTINSKADMTNSKVRDQDKQMKRILGLDKKKPTAAAKLDK